MSNILPVSSAYRVQLNKEFLNTQEAKRAEIAAKHLSDSVDLELYFKHGSNTQFCNHAVAVVAASAAVVAAVSSVIAASTRSISMQSKPIAIEETLISGLDVKSLMEIRENNL